MNRPSWDYSALAAHYERRAPYHAGIIQALCAQGAPAPPAPAVDIGAGTGRFTRMMIDAGYTVDAVEPNAQMRALGLDAAAQASWHDACAENTGLPGRAYSLVAFASSFNVVSAPVALAEASRLLAPGGALILLYNHRDLDDPLQRQVEACIRRHVPHFDTGSRREDPAPQIAAHGAFGEVVALNLHLRHRLPGAEFVDGFRAHATLIRQAGSAMESVLSDIAALMPADRQVEVPFTTRAWMARKSL
jgi:SAM-dependent methyltransferase